MTNTHQKVYLGDSVYAQCDGYHIILTTENSVDVTNKILLDPYVFDTLVKYEQELRELAERIRTSARASVT